MQGALLTLAPVPRRQAVKRPYLPSHGRRPIMGPATQGINRRPGTAHKGQLDRRYTCYARQKSQPIIVTHSPGNKKDNITVIYTPWSNLKKDGSMDVGQVSFKNQKKVRKAPQHQAHNTYLQNTIELNLYHNRLNEFSSRSARTPLSTASTRQKLRRSPI